MDSLLILILIIFGLFIVVALTSKTGYVSVREGYRDSNLFLNYQHMKDDWYPWSNYSIYDADANLLGYPYYNKAY